jgi:acetyl-CoA carboxylase carboxyl transferase subunit beta
MAPAEPLHPLVEEWDAQVRGSDPLGFPGYTPPEAESVVCGLTSAGYALIQGRFDVLGGSMGAAHGERVVRAYRRALGLRVPVVVVTSSGGARMQEGMISLIQMARTAAAARAHSDAGLLSVALHRSPTTGGVLASYSSLADVRGVVAGATIGFAGPRVVELTTGSPLPPGSHTASGAFSFGLVDEVVGVSAAEQAAWVETVLGLRDRPLVGSWSSPGAVDVAVASESGAAESGAWQSGASESGASESGAWQSGASESGASESGASESGAWQSGASESGASESGASESGAWANVLRSRAEGRPSGRAWAAALTRSWVPLNNFDPAVVAGLAVLRDSGRRVVVVALERGAPAPAGYRLAQRAFALAGRLGLPVVTLVDTPGADAAPRSESRGIAQEIARTFGAMAALPVVSVSVIVGEGGSGGALAVAFADRLFLLDGSVLSVMRPEGAAAILDRDTAAAPVRAEHLRLRPADMVSLGIADGVLPDGDVDTVLAAVETALDTAAVGDRLRRFDAATERWLR